MLPTLLISNFLLTMFCVSLRKDRLALALQRTLEEWAGSPGWPLRLAPESTLWHRSQWPPTDERTFLKSAHWHRMQEPSRWAQC